MYFSLYTVPTLNKRSISKHAKGIDEPSVQLQEPESASFIERGGDVILRCHLDASGEVHFEWFRSVELQNRPNCLA
ncbi:hypothetical protein NQ317_001169 [Molorchus minor]|uniref:Ig-like domain-containing protein n=1 Tax=Molorchus minor TaxID=1323400 RepID=A0ABQ9JW56_9CUCU|nr:hypothetical protein NQ317_001169 [Molorchus minor]